MTDNKKQTITIFVVIFFILILIAGYFFYKKFKESVVPPIKAIPENAAVIFEFNNIKDAWKKISQENDMWKSLTEINQINELNRQIKFIDSVSNTNSNALDILTNQKVYLTSFVSNDNKINLLYLIELSKTGQGAVFKNIIKDIYGTGCAFIKKDFKGITINKIILTDQDKYFFYAVTKGIFFGSYNISLIEESINQLKKKSSVIDEPAFKKVEQTAGKNVDANIYVNLKYFYRLLSVLTNSKYKTNIDLLSGFAQWTELDLKIKNNELLLNGYTIACDSLDQYLGLFENQSPQKIEITNILPYNTTILFDFGFENFNKFYTDYNNYLNKKTSNEFKKKVQRINNKYNINIEKHLLSWIGNEAAFVSTSKNLKSIKDNAYAVFHSMDISNAKKLLNQLGNKIPGNAGAITHKGYQIKNINIPSIIPMFWGSIFQNIEKNYYTVIENYIVFANNPSSLKKFINTFLSGKTLDLNENYKDFSDNISESSNIYLFYNIRNSIEVLKTLTNKNLSSIISHNANITKNFQSFALQLSFTNRMFYTNLYLKYNPSYKEENISVWKATLDENISGQPYFVKDHTDNTYNIVVYDIENNMYLVDNNGNILWKIPVAEPVISNVYPVDYYKNRKIQYLFNTENYIYLIDLKGRKVENYPIKLSKKATNGLTVFDYSGNKNYRIVYAGEDKKVYNYTIKGNEVDGWKNPKTSEIVNRDIQHLVTGGNDYILITDKEGKVKITDRRGRTRINLKSKLIKAGNSEFYVNRTNSKGIIITTDEKGNLTYITKSGNISKTFFREFSPDHYFLYEDFDKNGSKDFIYLDKNKLTVFDRFKKIIFEYEFKSEINLKPVIIPISKREILLGVVSDKTREIFLFDKKGNVIISSGLVGETPFAIGSLKNNKDLNLVVGSGNTLYNYLIK